MKNVTILINTLAFGGAEKQAVLLANALKSDYKVSLIVLYGDQIEDRLLQMLDTEKVQLIKLNQKGLIGRIVHVKKLLKQLEPSTLFTYLAQSNTIGIVAGKLAGVKKIYSGVRSDRIPRKKRIVQKFIHNYLNTGTIFNNYAGGDKMVAYGFSEKKAIVIPNGIEIQNREKNCDIKRDIKQVVVISLGRYLPVKNFSFALEVISEIIKNNPLIDLKYKLGGYGQEEDFLRLRIKELGLEENVELVINPKGIESFFLGGDIFLSTSLHEGTPNAVMEAMTFGLPIVATNVGDTGKLVRHNENGYVYEVNDKDFAVSSLINLIVNKNRRIEMGNKSYELISTNYSIEMLKKRYVEFIEKSGEK
jgi:glycosyltransferase involved in cell wall biosynthesis